MNRRPIRLGPDDPTIFAKCPQTRIGRGARMKDVFMAAFTPRKWKRGQSCPHCKRPLVKLYEVRTD